MMNLTEEFAAVSLLSRVPPELTGTDVPGAKRLLPGKKAEAERSESAGLLEQGRMLNPPALPLCPLLSKSRDFETWDQGRH